MGRFIFYSMILIFAGRFEVFAFQQGESVIMGKVSGSDGKPLTGATVIIDGSTLGTYTDQDGNYHLNGLADGTFRVKYSFVGFESQTRLVELKGKLVLDINLKPVDIITSDVLVTATRAGKNTPLAYSELGREELSRKNSGADIPFILSLTPSLVETSEAGNGIGYTGLRVRGTDANRINVTIDGIPLNDPESQQVFWVDLPDLASSVDNIQIQRGVGTSSNGAAAFGATINIQTRTPENEPFAEISSMAGSYGTFKNSISAGTGMLKEKFALQMRYSDLKSDGYIYRTGSDHRSAFISGIYRSKRSVLRTNIILGEEHTGIGWWGVPAEMLAADRRYNPAGEYTGPDGEKLYYNNESDNYNQNHFQLMWSHLSRSGLQINAAFHYTRGKGYYEEYGEKKPLADYGIAPYQIGDSTITVSDLIRRKWMANDFYGTVYSVKYKNDRLEAVAGGGANTYRGDHYGTLIWMSAAGPTPRDMRWYYNNSVKSEASIFGKVNYMLTDKLNIYGDLQFRYIFYNMKGPDDDLRDISQVHRFTFFNPKAGLFYNISPEQDVYASFSIANREPTRTDFKDATGDNNATPEAETLYDIETGYKLKRDKFSMGVNLYGMYYHNQLVPTGELSNVGYPIMTNVAVSHRIGAELSAAYKPIDFLELNSGLTVSKNRINNFTEFYTDYNTIDWSSEYKSRNLGNVDIAYSPSLIWTGDIKFLLTADIELHFLSKYVGKQYFDNTMSDDRKLDPYFVNNLRLDYIPKIKSMRGLEIQLIVNNVFSSLYESNAYGGNWYEDGVEKTWAYYFPQAPRNYLARITLQF